MPHCLWQWENGETDRPLAASWNAAIREPEKWASWNFDMASWRSHVSNHKCVSAITQHYHSKNSTFIKCQTLSVSWATSFNDRGFQVEFGDLDRLEMVGAVGHSDSLNFIKASLLNAVILREISVELYFQESRRLSYIMKSISSCLCIMGTSNHC